MPKEWVKDFDPSLLHSWSGASFHPRRRTVSEIEPPFVVNRVKAIILNIQQNDVGIPFKHRKVPLWNGEMDFVVGLPPLQFMKSGGHHITKTKNLIPNNFGMMVTGSYNTIGKIGYFANIICGNNTGIIIGGSELDGRYNHIRGNVIGTTYDSELGLGNQQGILVEGATSNFIEDNTTAGNTIHGVAIIGAPPESNSPSNVIRWNNIGINFYQNLAIPNNNGIVITDGTWLTDINNNIIAGNNQIGIFLKGINDTVQTKYVLIDDNYIGVNRDLVSFPNNTGIVVEGNVINIWIGSVIGQDYDPNFIISKTNAGIVVKPGSGGYVPEKVTFRKNIINQNIVTNLLVDPATNLGIQPPHDLSFSGTLLTGIHQFSNVVIDIYDANILGCDVR